MFFFGPNVPVPKNAKLKFTCKGNEIGIWGNSAGLKHLGELCIQLAENPSINHIHIDRATPADILLIDDSLFAFLSILNEE